MAWLWQPKYFTWTNRTLHSVQLVTEQKVFSLSNWSVQAHAIQVLHYAYNVQIKKHSVIFELEGWFEEFFIFLPPSCFASINNNLSLKPFWSHTFSHLCCNFLMVLKFRLSEKKKKKKKHQPKQKTLSNGFCLIFWLIYLFVRMGVCSSKFALLRS